MGALAQKNNYYHGSVVRILGKKAAQRLKTIIEVARRFGVGELCAAEGEPAIDSNGLRLAK